ncbi:MAG: ABC transporter permease subunit, partial [Pseudomonadota bacterium]
IYGLDGILVAHVFFNLPLAVRLLLASLERVPLEHWRVAQQLSLSPWMTFRVLEWPAMRNVIGGVAGLVFMLCLTSFAVVLILGGGPAATTLDVAIYQALRFDFDPQRAVALGVLQLAITAGALAILSLTGLRLREEPTASAVRTRPKSRGIVDAVLIAVATVFVASPILALAVRGLGADLARLAGDGAVLSAAATSIGVAFAAGLLGVATALALAHGRARAQYGRGVFAAAGSLTLVVSPVLLGAGWFVALNRFGGGLGLALPLLICANAALALPFAMRILDPAFASTAVRTDKLVAQLGLTDSARLRVVWWPMMRRPILSALAFAAALSLGDLGVIALIGSQDLTTLPALLMQRLGSYRTDDAAGLALILALLAGSIFALGDRGRSRL